MIVPVGPWFCTTVRIAGMLVALPNAFDTWHWNAAPLSTSDADRSV